MTVLVLILSLIIIALFVIIVSYRRQVKTICRHVSFIKDNHTNMNLYEKLPFRELNELIENINQTLIELKKTEIANIRQENNFKETITNLSHDIRTPLTSLDGYFQLLSETDDEEERIRYADVIRGRIDNLKTMLEELFTYTKLQNDNFETENVKVDFSKLVCDVTLAFYDEFKRNNIEPVINYPENRVFVDCNETAMTRVLENIIKNAITHGTGELELTLYPEDNTIRFVCKNSTDSRIDIDTDMAFSRFYKADQARSTGSSGLGLAIAKGFVEKMNGQIRAYICDEKFCIEIIFPVAE